MSRIIHAHGAVGGLLLATVLLPTTTEVHAQTFDTRLIEEIVVTARRREESLQEVPIAITALSFEDLRRAGLRDMTDLQREVPNLVMVPSNVSGHSTTSFRSPTSARNLPAIDIELAEEIPHEPRASAPSQCIRVV